MCRQQAGSLRKQFSFSTLEMRAGPQHLLTLHNWEMMTFLVIRAWGIFKYRHLVTFYFIYSSVLFNYSLYFCINFSCLWSSGAVKDLTDNNLVQGDGDDVRPPLPVKREVLYDNAVLYGYVVQLLVLPNLPWFSICAPLFFSVSYFTGLQHSPFM